MTRASTLRIAVLTSVTMIGFAANSVLCRAALGDRAIDAVSFSALRLVSGALMLLLVVRLLYRRPIAGQGGGWISGAFLFLYAVPFSFAYLTLSAGTGALILFGAVQMTMLVAALVSGEQPGLLQWIGFTVACAGLVYLLLPGLSAPSPVGAALMLTAGVAWGAYSLRGRRAGDAGAATADNFARSLPFVAVVGLFFLRDIHLTARGVALALFSGTIASSLIYMIWYAALKGLTSTRAAIAQLSVPALAAIGGIVFMSESLSVRFVTASVMILGGVAIAVASRQRRAG